MTVKWNNRAAQQVRSSQPVTDRMLEVGWKVAERAAALAPKATGAGARSIQAQLFRERGEYEVRVSWDRRHFYMYFAEVGTDRGQAPTPFLRPAARRYQ